jgi:cytochrome P450
MLPPGPRTPALWQTLRFVTNPGPYGLGIRKKYGDVASFHALFGDGVAVFESGLAREVFSAPPDTFATFPLVEALFGRTSVIAASGAPHRKLRKLLNPRFHGAQVKGFLAAMQRAIRVHVEGLARAAGTGEVIVLGDMTQSLSLDVIIETVFGAGELDRAVAREVLLASVHAISPAIVGGTTFHKPWFPPWRRFLRANEAFDTWVAGVIRQRRARGEEALGDDVLGVLLAARYEDGSPMDDEEVRDQLLTLLLAGHETSAIAMAWSVYHLLRTPDVLARLREEVDALGPDPAPEAVVRVPYLDAVVSETLRIEPIVTDVVRVCREPFTLGDRWTVPRGHAIVVMLLAILRDARVFPEPERFRPERFLEKKFSASEFLPFGGGARRCLGAAFAEAEVALAVAEIASQWELELASSSPEPSIRRNLTMGPKHGVRVRVLGRRARRAPGTIRAAS